MSSIPFCGGNGSCGGNILLSSAIFTWHLGKNSVALQVDYQHIGSRYSVEGSADVQNRVLRHPEKKRIHEQGLTFRLQSKPRTVSQQQRLTLFNINFGQTVQQFQRREKQQIAFY